MLSLESEQCHGCSRPLLDAGDELVCPGCGQVKEKTVVDPPGGRDGKLPLFGRQPLGSFMGTKEITLEERHSKVSSGSTSYELLKAISDHADREGSSVDCGRLIERVGEKLFLPRVVIMQAAAIAKKAFEERNHGRRLMVAEVSAYALVAACKMEGVTSASIREILTAYSDLGKRVTSSSLFRIAFDSPLKTYARTPAEYIPRVLAKLSTNRRLAGRLAREGVPPAAYLESLRRLAGEVLSNCDESLIAGKRPCALAAAAVYSSEVLLAHAEERHTRITQRECAECGDTAEYTIREQCARVLGPAVARLRSAGAPSRSLRAVRQTAPPVR